MAPKHRSKSPTKSPVRHVVSSSSPIVVTQLDLPDSLVSRDADFHIPEQQTDGRRMTTPVTNAQRNKKNRPGRRLVLWVILIVILTAFCMLSENEYFLMSTDDAVTSNDKQSSKGRDILKVGSQGPLEDASDDELNSYWWSDPQRRDKDSITAKPPSRQKSKTKTTKKKKKKKKKKLNPLPVIQYDDDAIPQGVAGSITHAADALLCRNSVVDYVINATDLKDECDGLKKAFTKTCSDDDDDAGDALSKRRRLQETTASSKNPIMYWQHKVYRLSRSVQQYWWRSPREDIFLVEDKVLEAWGDAAVEVELGWDLLYRQDDVEKILQPVVPRYDDENDDNDPNAVGPSVQHRQLISFKPEQRRDGDKDHRMAEEAMAELLEEDDFKLGQQPKENTTASRPVKDGNKIMANLALPTTMKHVSGKMLSQTLMLQQDNKLMKAVQNQTNHTATEAQVDAAASSKAVSDAANMVSSVLNDPTSVEARTCCTSILNVFHENCNVDDDDELSDSRLFVAVVVIAFCGMIKSLIRHFSIRWLPEAAGCILVGVAAGYIMTFYPHHDISFDGHWFLRIMVPPIVFEAALSIDKRSFNRHVVPILIYAVIGTLVATGLTAIVLHQGSKYCHGLCETIPYPEALTFGALISSIDPIAVLSVLSNMGMTDTDTIYVVIFGESLLNDGVAIVLFETLVHFLDDNMEVDSHAIVAAAIHFLVVFVGSLLIGIGSGLCSTLYYWLMHGCQTPLVEVLMFCCWALLPYYVCDGIEWSGIVSVVAAGFIMDIFIVGTHFNHEPMEGLYDSADSFGSENGHGESSSDVSTNDKSPKMRRHRSQPMRRPIFSKHGLLSKEAKTHIGFVTEIIATMMETAIFAYLGLFLFSSRYHWNFYHVLIGIGGCCLSRAIMIPSLSLVANWITLLQRFRTTWRSQHLPQQAGQMSPSGRSHNAAGVVIDGKMQMVLWFAGLRGAMSFALVESIPLYDAVTGEGTRLKSELKAMTSASIIFTVFVLGGATFYMMDSLGMAPNQGKDTSGASNGGSKPQSMLEREMEMIGLLRVSEQPDKRPENELEESSTFHDEDPPTVFPVSGKQPTSRRPGRPGTFQRQRKLPQET